MVIVLDSVSNYLAKLREDMWGFKLVRRSIVRLIIETTYRAYI